jgi:glutathione synthase/RimK-type ligase-like ATP-grasp enzyme
LKKIAIFTIAGDIHAGVIYDEIITLGGDCFVVESDKLTSAACLNANILTGKYSLVDRNGRNFDIGELDLVWWRRAVRAQSIDLDDFTEVQKDVINNDCEATLLGMLFAAFKGTWVSHPLSTRLAANKVLQGKVAQDVGLYYPKTLVSQNPAEVFRFIEENEGRLIVKPVHGTIKLPLYTQAIDLGNLPSADDIAVCPTTYQELIPGNVHYRINIFGDKVFAFQLESADLDWRPDLTVPFKIVPLSENIELKLKRLLKVMGLAMGIIDMKVHDENGKVYFLEVNPQGQFLFLQAITGFDLGKEFAAFLLDLACKQEETTSKFDRAGIGI